LSVEGDAGAFRLRGAPTVVLMVGVNGAGKTTTIGKLATKLVGEGRTCVLAAGDTFRAAAVQQLVVWGERVGCEVVRGKDGADPGSVVFDAIKRAQESGADVVLADTAGRLPTQLHLMDEIRKVKRVMAKADPSAPHETLLVVDANTGQNAVRQVKAFDDALGLTGLVMTKLDGTAKGGAVAAIAREHPVPIRFIGIGEKASDLRAFVARDFVEALFA
jgi:fused signal recognition particle receptor